MKKFVSAHIVACLTRQAIMELLRRFKESSGEEVQFLHAWCDTIAGRMVCEWRARDKQILLDWLERQHVRIRGQSEWVFQPQFEANEAEVSDEL